MDRASGYGPEGLGFESLWVYKIDSYMEIFILIIASFITSSISAVIGMGGGIILLGIMTFFIPQGYMVVALHGIIQLISNLTRTYIFRKNINTIIIRRFFSGAFLGVSISIVIILLLIKYFNVKSADQIKIDILTPIIGIFILWNLFFKKYTQDINNNSFFIAGLISGISSIFVGATGPLIAPFFLNKKLLKENIIANKAACQVITHLSKIPIFIYLFNVNYIREINILIPLICAVFIGTKLGKNFLKFMPDKIFEKTFRIVLCFIALKLLLGY